MSVISQLVAAAEKQGCSDIHITVPNAHFRKDGRLFCAVRDKQALTAGALEELLTDDAKARLARGESFDYGVSASARVRLRVHLYPTQSGIAAAIRLLPMRVPSFQELGLPAVISQLSRLSSGLVIIAGPTGSGKSSTLAAMVSDIAERDGGHIVTIEEPVEYLFSHGKALIHQREVGTDVANFSHALVDALREDPDVIMVGEMRDQKTIQAALTAAETGHLVLSTLHTTSAAESIERIVDVFPAEGQRQIRTQLAAVIGGVVCQRLVPAIGGGRRPAHEVLVATSAVRSMIREGRTHQIPSVLQTGRDKGMHTLSTHLASLVREGTVSRDTAMRFATDPEGLARLLD